MGLDKFGRHSAKAESIKGPKGDGFNLTDEGNYDCEGKRLCNSGNPVEDSDCVNLRTLNNTTNSCLKIGTKRKAYDAIDNPICNVGVPIEDGDAVTIGYLHTKIPKKLKDSFSMHHFRVQDIAYPKDDGDAANLAYIKDKCVMATPTEIDARQRRITNVNDPVEPTDAVNKRSVPDSTQYYWSFAHKRLVSVNDPIDPTDVVNLRTLETTLTTFWSSGKRWLVIFRDPVDEQEPVNLRTLNARAKSINDVLDSLKTRISKMETDIENNRKQAERQLTKFSQLLYPYLNKSKARTETNYIEWDKVFQ